MIKKETYITCPDVNIFEGMTSLSAIIQNEEDDPQYARKIVRVLVDKSKIKSKQREIAFLKRKALILGFEIVMVDTCDIDAISTGDTHGGIIAICEARTIPLLDKNSLKAQGFYVMLEGVEDPYNFGYSVRSIYAAGADGIILSKRNWMEVAGIVSKSSAGTSERIPMFIAEAEDAISVFHSLNYKIVAAGIRNSVSMYEADMTPPILLVVGGEKRGISASLLSKVDSIVRIEYGRKFNGSLSTASAATILCYEVLRQVKS